MPDSSSYTLRYPVWFTFLNLLCGIVGTICLIDWFWTPFLPFAIEELEPHDHAFLLFLPPIGIGFGLMSFKKISVSGNSIRSHWFGWEKQLEFASTIVHKNRQTYYVLKDAHGIKILIHHLMEQAGILLSEIVRQQSLRE